MRKTLALLTATAALASTAQAAIACDHAPAPTTDLQLVAKPLDRRPSVAMPSCPDCRYHLLDTRS